MQEYGSLIREHRKKLGLTQQKLASSLRLSRTTISQIETGAPIDIGARKLSRLCDRVGLCLQIVPRQAPMLETLLKANAARRAANLKTASAILTGKTAARKPAKNLKADDHA